MSTETDVQTEQVVTSLRTAATDLRSRGLGGLPHPYTDVLADWLDNEATGHDHGYFDADSHAREFADLVNDSL